MAYSTVTVIGLGAMGGGMARAVLRSNVSQVVIGYDRALNLVEDFHHEALAVKKAPKEIPRTLADAITSGKLESETSSTIVQAVLLVLVNESQCEEVCFGEGENLLFLLTPKYDQESRVTNIVILHSTVSAAWARRANERFRKAGVLFCDSPISGGPVRALAGDLTLMASGDEQSLQYARPVLEALSNGAKDVGSGDIYIISGGAGMGSTAKMVHQLLAGVHVCVTAEALALAAKAGLDVEQMYHIVNGAAGASWMFQDRGRRMIYPSAKVNSALDIFVKDLDIIYSEAKALKFPIPVASAALQQFITAQGLGLGSQDDSQLVQTYERVSGVAVAKSTTVPSASRRLDDEDVNNGDDNVWKMEDGQVEEILEVGSEPRHHIVLRNDYVRVLLVSFPPNDTTAAHRHIEDSLYFFLVEGGLEVVNHVQGSDPVCDCMEFGEVRYGSHKSDNKPLVHKITNKTNKTMLCIDAEVLKQPPMVSAFPFLEEKHELVKTRNKCRVYRLALAPGESASVGYPFFHLTVVLEASTIQWDIPAVSGGRLPTMQWKEAVQVGDVRWKEPTAGEPRLTNVGESTFVMFISEWC